MIGSGGDAPLPSNPPPCSLNSWPPYSPVELPTPKRLGILPVPHAFNTSRGQPVAPSGTLMALTLQDLVSQDPSCPLSNINRSHDFESKDLGWCVP